MKQYLMLLFCVILIGAVQSQGYDVGSQAMQGNNPFLIGSQQVNTIKYSRLVEGSPFFWDDYQPATIGTKKGEKYAGMKVKLNLTDQELYYMDDKGKELVLTSPVDYVIVSNPTIPATVQFEFFPKAAEAQPWGWIQLLTKGTKVAVYKRHMKTMEETTPYGSATKEQKILTNYQYYALSKGTWIKLKKMEDVADINPEKRDEVLALIKSYKLKWKDDKDWAKLAAVL
jgi:hypothetical protein